MTSPFLYLAPIRGLTDAIFRETYSAHFTGFDSAVAPFINPQRKSSFKEKHLRDVLPQYNTSMPLVPQLLHTSAEDFLALATKLEDLGYDHINWNLGCPAPMVANKGRGSGFLPYPEEIIAFLDTVIPKLNCSLSIKTRLGFSKHGELETLLPELNQFPLKEIIIHARLGKQLYSGNTHIDKFSCCLKPTQHRLVYNGDIIDMDSYSSLCKSLPTISRWMIGRGAIANPLLPAMIRGENFSKEEKQEKIRNFHNDIYQNYQQRFSGPSHILGRMKQIWQYLIYSFPKDTKTLKKINKVKQPEKYEQLIEELFGS